MTDTRTTARPTAKKPLRQIDDALRERIATAVEMLIAALDATEDTDTDEAADDRPVDDHEREYSLGATDEIRQGDAWRVSELQRATPDGEIGLGTPQLWEPRSQVFDAAAFGADDDREMHEDDEPSLAAIENHPRAADVGQLLADAIEGLSGFEARRDGGGSQVGLFSGSDADLEEEHDGREDGGDLEYDLVGAERHLIPGPENADGELGGLSVAELDAIRAKRRAEPTERPADGSDGVLVEVRNGVVMVPEMARRLK